MRGFDTEAVHAGEEEDDLGSLEAPVHVTAAYAFRDAADAAARFAQRAPGEIYARWRNPTVCAFERKMASLEGAEAAVALASGMGAVSGALSANLRAGDHVVAPNAVYAETAKVLRERFARFGVETTFTGSDADAVRAAIRPTTRVVWCETPANPVLSLADIPALADVASSAGAVLVVDSTFATPYHQQPLALGAQLVVHSATKAIGGHGDALGGVVCGDAARIEAIQADAVRGGGAALSPHVAALLDRGARTLGLRMQRASASAATLAERLEAHPRVTRVSYPGLRSHPQFALAERQMTRGFGALVAFEVEGGAARVYDAVTLVRRAVSLGDVRSLITCPAATTHASMRPEQRRAAGIGEGLMRLSVGIEDVEDLWDDLSAALG